MCWDFCTTTKRTAKKEHHCGAAEWINKSGYGEADYAPEDWVTIKVARAEGNKILPGTEYFETSGKFDGRMDVFRARLDLHAICLEYELYGDC